MELLSFGSPAAAPLGRPPAFPSRAPRNFPRPICNPARTERIVDRDCELLPPRPTSRDAAAAGANEAVYRRRLPYSSLEIKLPGLGRPRTDMGSRWPELASTYEAMVILLAKTLQGVGVKYRVMSPPGAVW